MSRIDITVNPGNASQQVVAPFMVTSSATGITSSDKTYRITMANPLTAGQFARFRVESGGNAPAEHTITYPDQFMILTWPHPGFIGTTPHKVDLVVTILDGTSPDTPVNHELLFGNDSVAIHGQTYTGTFTVELESVDVPAGIGGFPSSTGKSTQATITMTHPDGNVTYTTTPIIPEVGMIFRQSGTSFNSVSTNIIDASPTSIRVLFSLFLGEAGQESFNIILN